jgi:hypothetical protein|tara:strand:+ start:2911 stop:3321 length:411 start_codon:yes stop_codon:yes gene_type:complete
MNKNDLKKVLKPLIKECIKEVIFEDGTLSGIISEVAQGLSTVQSVVPQQITEKKVIRSNQPSEALVQAKRDLEETKRSLQESTGLSGIFEGTTPMRSGGGSSGSKHGALRDHDPGDPGVDISGIMSIAGNAWKQLK